MIPLSYLLLGCLLLFLAIFTALTFKSYRLYARYRSILTQYYKPFINSFNLLGIPESLFTIMDDEKKHGDSHNTIKHVYPSYDLTL